MNASPEKSIPNLYFCYLLGINLRSDHKICKKCLLRKYNITLSGPTLGDIIARTQKT